MPFAPSDVFSKRASRNLTAPLLKDTGTDTASEGSATKKSGPEAADRTLAAKATTKETETRTESEKPGVNSKLMTEESKVEATSQAGLVKPSAEKHEGRKPGVKPTTNSLVQLAATITRETEKLDRYIKESGAPAPSFDIDGPLDFPKLPDEIKTAREEIVRATKELGDLVTGPREGVRWMAWDVSFAGSCL